MQEGRHTSLRIIFEIVDVKSGTFGLVYICSLRGRAFGDASLRPLFAVKVLPDKYLGNEDLVKNFYREAETWVKLGRHENIVRADFVLEIDQRPHIFMEYVDGGSLRDWMLRGGRDLRQSLDFAIQFCDGMVYANNKDLGQGEKGIVHRDIKPENVMLTRNRILKIIDFGLVKAFGPPEIQPGKPQRSPIMGTPAYMAPEQFTTMDVDQRADIYSFGVVLYEMLTGERPFKGPEAENYAHQHTSEPPPPPTRLNSNIPKELEHIVLKCLNKEPEDRYRSFEGLRTELVETYQRLFGRRPERKKAIEGRVLPVIDRSMLKGLSLSSLGKMREAIPLLDEAIKKDPRNVLAWYSKGYALDRMGKHEEAIECFDKALEIDPRDVAAWSGKGDALGNLGRYEEAIRCFDRANELKPGNPDRWSAKGLALVGLRRYKEAVECFDRVLEIYPRNAKAWSGRAVALVLSDRLQDAVRCYDKATELNPRDATTWYDKGNALCRLGRFGEAIPCFDKALEMDPRNANAWASKGAALASLGRLEEAIRCCNRALETNPSHELAKRLRELTKRRIAGR